MRNFKTMVLTLMAAVMVTLSGYAQVHNPVKWKFTTESLGNNEFNLIFTADIEHPWHMYGMENHGDDGPVPTSFKFLTKEGFELVGDFSEPAGVVVEEPMFGITLKYFEHKATFKQKIKLTAPEAMIKGEVDWMVCDDSQCLPPDYVEFTFDLKGEAEKTAVPEAQKEPETAMMDAPEMGAEPESGILKPVTWSFEIEDLGNNEYNLKAVADIKEHWHLYSMNLPSQDGPIATEFNVLNETGVESIGKAEEIGTIHTDYDKNFMMDLTFFENTATLVQKVKVTDASEIKVEVYFMACDDSQCITPEAVEHTFNLSEKTAVESSSPAEGESEEGRSLWGIFIVAFLSGFAALLTPCVFPMIPMTVSFFTKQSKTKAEGISKAITYGISIIVIYVLLGVVVTAVFGAESLSLLATDPWFNLFFFVLLVVFAVSFLGAFEITLPSSWVNKADAKADKGGLIGIFFMALVLALVSFSCTGPIVGTLIVEAASKGGIAPVIGMLGFSLAIALPFTLFAMFPGWLNSLPQSGGWLNSVKVVLGFLELALAFKFLSNADLVLDLHLLEREMFIAIWVVIFGLLTMYLLGKLKLPHDSPLPHIGVGRLMLAIFFGVFTVYMIPGMWGAPVKIISAFPPPLEYSESPLGVGFQGGGSGVAHVEAHEDMHRGPQGIMVFHDYDKALAHAKEVNKPLMIDFTGKACVNCRKMEQDVWSDAAIKASLSNDVVLVSLYVDSRIDLPESEQIEVEYPDGRVKKLRTEGDKWAYKQIVDYKSNSQPLYILQDVDGNDITPTANYQDHGSIPVFKKWLDDGLAAFNK